MDSTRRSLVAAAFVGLSVLVSVLAAPELPTELVTHWNAAGEPDGTMSRTVALALIPGLSAVLLGLFVLIPRVDPLRANIAAFRRHYDWFVVLFTAYMFLVHAGIVAFNLGYEFDFLALVMLGVAGLLYYVGVLLETAKRNWFVGIRTPWTLSSDAVWDATHQLGSRLFKICALAAVFAIFAGEYAVYFVLVPTLGTAVITFVYSYVMYERLEGAAAVGSKTSEE
jgi:uncharacterized membrane protein